MLRHGGGGEAGLENIKNCKIPKRRCSVIFGVIKKIFFKILATQSVEVILYCKKKECDMQITTNYSIPKTQTKRQSGGQVNFGRVIGERDRLLKEFGLRRLDIIDKVSDDNKLDVLVKKGLDNQNLKRTHAYIVPKGTDIDPKDYNTRIGVGWLVPKGHRIPEAHEPRPAGGVFVLEDSHRILGAGESFLYPEHPEAFYMILMRKLCLVAAERKIMSALKGREVDFMNQADAYKSTNMRPYTLPYFNAKFSTTKSENRKNHENLVNATADTFERVIDRMAAYEVLLEKRFGKKEDRERWVRKNKRQLYPTELFNDQQWAAKQKEIQAQKAAAKKGNQ